MSISEQKARSIRRKRLGVIDEDGEEDELREVVFEAKTGSLRRSVRKKINKKEEVELVSFSNKKRDSVTSESKLLVSPNSKFITSNKAFYCVVWIVIKRHLLNFIYSNPGNKQLFPPIL